MFGGGAKYITKSQVRHSTVNITDFNTEGKCIKDPSQIQIFFSNSAFIITLCRLYAIVINVLHFCFELHTLKMTSKMIS